MVIVDREKCGMCFFAAPMVQDVNMVECYGSPPQLLFMGYAKNVAGQDQPMIQGLIPTVHKQRKGCALWRPANAALSS